MVDVAERIKKARKAAGLTQRALTEKIHMSQSYIGDIESCRSNLSLSALQLISNVLRVDISEFVGNSTTVQETGLNADEIDLVMAYRSLSEDQKALTKAMVYNFVPPKSARYSTTSILSQRTRTSKMAMGG